MKPRTIHLQSFWLEREGMTVRLRGRTEQGGEYSIMMRLDGADAVCAIATLGQAVAEEVERQRRDHDWMRDRIASAWRTVHWAVKGEKPAGGAS